MVKSLLSLPFLSYPCLPSSSPNFRGVNCLKEVYIFSYEFLSNSFSAVIVLIIHESDGCLLTFNLKELPIWSRLAYWLLAPPTHLKNKPAEMFPWPWLIRNTGGRARLYFCLYLESINSLSLLTPSKPRLQTCSIVWVNTCIGPSLLLVLVTRYQNIGYTKLAQVFVSGSVLLALWASAGTVT